MHNMTEEGKRIIALVGARVRKQREQANLSQDDLAKQVGLSQSKIARLEVGNTDTLDVVAVAHIADALNFPLNIFLDDLLEAAVIPKAFTDFIIWMIQNKVNEYDLHYIQKLVEIYLAAKNSNKNSSDK
jgi:transcriptional regulator with XRE-family HTH domain